MTPSHDQPTRERGDVAGLTSAVVAARTRGVVVDLEEPTTALGHPGQRGCDRVLLGEAQPAGEQEEARTIALVHEGARHPARNHFGHHPGQYRQLWKVANPASLRSPANSVEVRWRTFSSHSGRMPPARQVAHQLSGRLPSARG